MGGPHTSFYSEEAAEHCDAVGIGEGETIWPRMLEDALLGRLRKMYRPEGFHPLRGLPFPRYDLLNHGRYGLMRTFSVQTSRGCPFRCGFCSERFYLGHKYRYRPVEEVVEEIKGSRARNILFADSNFAGKTSHAMELMEALIPLKIRWSSLFSAYLCRKAAFLDLAKRSGLFHVNLGIESIDGNTLAGMNKRVNKVREYREIFAALGSRGISYSVNLIFGWDTETPDVFRSTLAFLMEHKVPVAYFNILTPHRGTPLYETMKAAGRILDDHNMGRWPGLHCHIDPAYCKAEELERQVNDLNRAFFSLPSMVKRLPFPSSKADIASWVINLSQRKVSRAEDGMENFDDY